MKDEKMTSLADLSKAVEKFHNDIFNSDEALTPMEYLKQYLGVVDGEEFDVYDEYGDCIEDCPYHFSGNQFINKRHLVDDIAVYDLLTGEYTIKKRPFVPKYGETYYIVHINGKVCADVNLLYVSDLAKIKCGWVFRTEAEAEANKERVMKEMKEVMGE